MNDQPIQKPDNKGNSKPASNGASPQPGSIIHAQTPGQDNPNTAPTSSASDTNTGTMPAVRLGIASSYRSIFWRAAFKVLGVTGLLYIVYGVVMYLPLYLKTFQSGGEGSFWGPLLVIAFVPAFIAIGLVFTIPVSLLFAWWIVVRAKKRNTPISAVATSPTHILRFSVIGIALQVFYEGGFWLFLVSLANRGSSTATNPAQFVGMVGVIVVLLQIAHYVGYGLIGYAAYSAFTQRKKDAQSLKRGEIIILVVAIVVAGLVFASDQFSNSISRQAGNDNVKAQDIDAISADVNDYTSNHTGEPPSSLSDVSNTIVDSKGKPNFSQYQYQKLSDKTYQVCTTFSASLRGSGFSSPGNPDPADGHGAGYQCYTFNAMQPFHP